MTPAPPPPARPPVLPPGAARPFVVVTGLSGAGKASVLRMLEDLGFESIDNPPLAVLEELVGDGGQGPLAVGLDARSRGFEAEALLRRMARLRGLQGLAPELIYVTAEPAVLMRRFSETRRRHPLAPGGSLGGSVADGIAREEALLAPLREAADAVLDTTELPLPELRRLIEGRFRLAQGPEGMAVAVLSFAFPRGLPREADLVFDLRFLRNPHYDPELRPQTGRDAAVAGFIRADAAFGPFWQRMTALLDPLLPRYAAEGKKYLTVALGCTGGKHRSVLLAELLAGHLAGQGWRVDLRHRELAAAGPVPTGPAEPGAGGGAATGPEARDEGATGQDARDGLATGPEARDGLRAGQDARCGGDGPGARAEMRGPGARDGAVAPHPHPGREAPSCTL